MNLSWKTTWCWWCRLAHEWADHEVEVGDMCRQKLMLREFGSGSRRVVEQALAAAGIKAKDLCTGMEFDSNEGLLSAVEAGLGVTFVSRWAVRNQLALGTLKLARIRGLKLSRQFSMAYPAGPEPTGSVGAFRAVLLTHAQTWHHEPGVRRRAVDRTGSICDGKGYPAERSGRTGRTIDFSGHFFQNGFRCLSGIGACVIGRPTTR